MRVRQIGFRISPGIGMKIKIWKKPPPSHPTYNYYNCFLGPKKHLEKRNSKSSSILPGLHVSGSCSCIHQNVQCPIGIHSQLDSSVAVFSFPHIAGKAPEKSTQSTGKLPALRPWKSMVGNWKLKFPLKGWTIFRDDFLLVPGSVAYMYHVYLQAICKWYCQQRAIFLATKLFTRTSHCAL